MQLDHKTIYWIAGAAIGGAALLYYMTTAAPAADLGGNCCADLEERIAELEATTAKKGNRKMSLTIYGQVNKALLYVDGFGDDDQDQFVIENSNAESFVGFSGAAKFAPNWKAGYVLEVGVGGFDDAIFDYGPHNANGLYARRSYVYVEGPMGQIGIGKQSQATDGIAEISVANTQVVSRMLTLRPLNGPEFGEVLDVFDGTRTNVVRYDTPVLSGFMASASWTNGNADDSNVWDVALRYAGEFGGFRTGVGIGYRRGLAIPDFAAGGGDDLTVLSGSASVMHIETGLFVNGAYGDAKVDGLGSLKAWEVQGGIERKWNSLGKTTLFAEYAKAREIDLAYWGGGIVQNLEEASTDLYLTVRRLEVGSSPEMGFEEEDVIKGPTTDKATTFMAGARVKF